MPPRLLLLVPFLAIPFLDGPSRAAAPSLKGTLLDLTNNHGRDLRLWSPTLEQARSVYVYLPPGYCPCKRYPALLWLHAMDQDEQGFLTDALAPIEKAILDGTLPPLIVAAPDGRIGGPARVVGNGSFFLNTPRGGNFEDYLIQDVWGLLQARFPIRPEPRAHILAGPSMGGFAAFNKVLKYPDTFGVAVGIFPPLHLRYADCQGGPLGNFDPACRALRTDFSDPRTVIGRYFHFFTVRQGDVLAPLYDPADPHLAARIAAENPYELLDARRHGCGKVALYASYGTHDEFNLDAQIQAFEHRAKELGIPVATERRCWGHHMRPTAMRLLPGCLRWLGKQLEGLGP